MVGLPDGEKILRICATVQTQYQRVTDGQTDRWTDGHLATAWSALCVHVAQYKRVKCPSVHVGGRTCAVNILKTLRAAPRDRWAYVDETWHVYSMRQNF